MKTDRPDERQPGVTYTPESDTNPTTRDATITDTDKRGFYNRLPSASADQEQWLTRETFGILVNPYHGEWRW